MKKIFYILLLFLAPVFSGLTQTTFPEIGKIDIAELRLNSCSFEADAQAMKLFDLQETEYEPNAFGDRIKTTKRVRIKIFSEKGYPFATIKIPYYSKRKNTKVTQLSGAVYNLDQNGNIQTQKLEEADFFTGKIMDRVGMINFTFPGLKPGSVIEYSYTLVEKQRLTIDNWLIQSELPSAFTSLQIIVPAFSSIKAVIFGTDSVSQKTEKFRQGIDKNRLIYYKENIVSFKAEPFMSSPKDYLLRMGFQFYPNGNGIAEGFSTASIWKMAGNMLLRSPGFNEQLTKVIPGTEKLVDTAIAMQYIPDRIRYVFRAVQKRFSEKTGQAIDAEDMNDAWKSRSGTSAEINMILLNLLRRADIKCHPVLVSTRNNGKVNTEFPNFGQFNGLNVLITDKGINYLLDASIKYQAYDAPPFNILNRQAFLLADNIQWIMVSDERPLLKQDTDVFGIVNEKGILEGSASIRYYDYAKSLALDSTLDEDNETRFYDKSTPGLKILTDKMENADSDEPLVHRLEFDYEPQVSGDFIFINPQLLSARKKNPFLRDKRKTDIDFGSNQEYRLNFQLEIPASLQVEHLPQNLVLRSSDSSLIFTSFVSANGANISYSQVLEIKKSIFRYDEYGSLFEFYKRIYTLMSEEIVLKKKK